MFRQDGKIQWIEVVSLIVHFYVAALLTVGFFAYFT